MYIQKYFIWHKYKTLRGVKWIGGGYCRQRHADQTQVIWFSDKLKH
jgi:hypothetical protein